MLEVFDAVWHPQRTACEHRLSLYRLDKGISYALWIDAAPEAIRQ